MSIFLRLAERSFWPGTDLACPLILKESQAGQRPAGNFRDDLLPQSKQRQATAYPLFHRLLTRYRLAPVLINTALSITIAKQANAMPQPLATKSSNEKLRPT